MRLLCFHKIGLYRTHALTLAKWRTIFISLYIYIYIYIFSCQTLAYMYIYIYIYIGGWGRQSASQQQPTGKSFCFVRECDAWFSILCAFRTKKSVYGSVYCICSYDFLHLFFFVFSTAFCIFRLSSLGVVGIFLASLGFVLFRLMSFAVHRRVPTYFVLQVSSSREFLRRVLKESS